MKEKYIEDLEQIRDIMNRSTRFISLSGISGISAGIMGLTGVYIAWQSIFKGQNYLVADAVELGSEHLMNLLLMAMGVLILATGSAIYFTTRKTKMQNQSVWNEQAKRLLVNLSIPLITGGLLCLLLLLKGFVGLAVPLTLVFYGLALVNASKYTLHEIRSLGIIEILLGLIAVQYVEYSLLFWAIGFGILHIVYGIIIQWKYKS